MNGLSLKNSFISSISYSHHSLHYIGVLGIDEDGFYYGWVENCYYCSCYWEAEGDDGKGESADNEGNLGDIYS